MYEYETFGKGNLKSKNIFEGKIKNGYVIGKRKIDITVGIIKEQLECPGWGNVIEQMYLEGDLPKWFLNGMFKKFIKKKCKEHGNEFPREFFEKAKNRYGEWRKK